MQTPYYLIDADAILHNLEILRGVMDRTGAHILLAQKAFSCYALYPMIGEYLSGATASGLFEARLCHEEMVKKAENLELRAESGKRLENHIFSPAFREDEIDEIVEICDHIVFNSTRQLDLFAQKAKDHGCQVGLRINPECSTQEAEHAIYDPCAPGSRLGTTVEEFRKWMESGRGDVLDGLHFHTLCEQNSDALAVTLDAVVEKFGEWLPQMKWINFGGGHHITREDYDIPTLEKCIMRMKDDYDLDVYLEPGEAVALNAGTLHTTILEVQPTPDTNQPTPVILDTSAACHMPDVIEMPYTPPLRGAQMVNETNLSSPPPGEVERGLIYRLGGPTCLAGDIIGTYSFEQPLKEGDVLVFEDMAIYSMVKTNTFNGMPLPSIYIKEGNNIGLWKSFSYDDFKSRL